MNAVATIPVFQTHNSCLTCGYDLFGQPRAGVCPECGSSTRESARHEAFLGAPGNLQRLRKGAVCLLIGAILSGLCPASCLLFMAMDQSVVAAVMMTLVFGATVATSAIGERSFAALSEYQFDDANDREARAGRRRMLLADLIAGAGLVLVNVAAYAFWVQDAMRSMSVRLGSGAKAEVMAGAIVALGFLLMSITAWRAAPSYRMRSDVGRAVFGRRMGGFIVLGHIKAICETVWLASIWIGLALTAAGHDLEGLAVVLLFGSLFGLFGYGVIWLFMILTHAILVARIRKQFAVAARGFEVVATPVGIQ